MRRTLTATARTLTAAMLIVATMVMVPVTAQAGSSDAATRMATVAAVESVMMAQYPEGTPYDNSVKYVSNCKINGQNLVYTGYGCVGFALQFEETTFGKGGSYTKTANADITTLQAGDIVRIPTAVGGHTVVIISMDETGATIAEANYNGAVHYGRHLSTAELATNEYVMHRV